MNGKITLLLVAVILIGDVFVKAYFANVKSSTVSETEALPVLYNTNLLDSSEVADVVSLGERFGFDFTNVTYRDLDYCVFPVVDRDFDSVYVQAFVIGGQNGSYDGIVPLDVIPMTTWEIECRDTSINCPMWGSRNNWEDMFTQMEDGMVRNNETGEIMMMFKGKINW